MGNDPLTTKLRKPYQDKKKPENRENHQKSEHESLVGVIACGGRTSLGREGPGEVGGCAGADPSCVGGSGRGEEQPERVQCYNRVSDGRGVQWECKAVIDNGLRFGQVEVVCEGYDYPDDPYILAGSCGLEHTLELTKEGREKRSNSGGGGGWGGGWQNPGNSYSSKSYYDSTSSQSSGLGDLILLGVVGIVIYAVYKTCVDAPSMGDREYGTGSTGGGGMGGGGWTNPGGAGGARHLSSPPPLAYRACRPPALLRHILPPPCLRPLPPPALPAQAACSRPAPWRSC